MKTVANKELEKIRKQGLKALRDTLGVEGMIKFLKMYGDTKGDYTKERQEWINDITEDEIKTFIKEN